MIQLTKGGYEKDWLNDVEDFTIRNQSVSSFKAHVLGTSFIETAVPLTSLGSCRQEIRLLIIVVARLIGSHTAADPTRQENGHEPECIAIHAPA